jgi:hypothetical protein
MARKKKLNVDYFPHFISRGSKISYLEHKYGNDGYATWFKILEELAKADYHFLDLSKEMTMMFLSDKCKIDEDKLLEIISDLVRMEVFHKELWNQKILYCPTFIESVSDVWERRKVEMKTPEDLMKPGNPKKPEIPKTDEKPVKKKESILKNVLFKDMTKEMVPISDWEYWEIAKAFYDLIQWNLQSIGANTRNIDNVKYHKFMNPIRLMVPFLLSCL